MKAFSIAVAVTLVLAFVCILESSAVPFAGVRIWFCLLYWPRMSPQDALTCSLNVDNSFTGAGAGGGREQRHSSCGTSRDVNGIADGMFNRPNDLSQLLRANQNPSGCVFPPSGLSITLTLCWCLLSFTQAPGHARQKRHLDLCPWCCNCCWGYKGCGFCCRLWRIPATAAQS